MSRRQQAADGEADPKRVTFGQIASPTKNTLSLQDLAGLRPPVNYVSCPHTIHVITSPPPHPSLVICMTEHRGAGSRGSTAIDASAQTSKFYNPVHHVSQLQQQQRQQYRHPAAHDAGVKWEREPAAVRLAEDQLLQPRSPQTDSVQLLREAAATSAITRPLHPLRVGEGNALVRRASGAGGAEGQQLDQQTVGSAFNVANVLHESPAGPDLLAADHAQEQHTGVDTDTHASEGEGTGKKGGPGERGGLQARRRA